MSLVDLPEDILLEIEGHISSEDSESLTQYLLAQVCKTLRPVFLRQLLKRHAGLTDDPQLRQAWLIQEMPIERDSADLQPSGPEPLLTLVLIINKHMTPAPDWTGVLDNLYGIERVLLRLDACYITDVELASLIERITRSRIPVLDIDQRPHISVQGMHKCGLCFRHGPTPFLSHISHGKPTSTTALPVGPLRHRRTQSAFSTNSSILRPKSWISSTNSTIVASIEMDDLSTKGSKKGEVYPTEEEDSNENEMEALAGGCTLYSPPHETTSSTSSTGTTVNSMTRKPRITSLAIRGEAMMSAFLLPYAYRLLKRAPLVSLVLDEMLDLTIMDWYHILGPSIHIPTLRHLAIGKLSIAFHDLLLFLHRHEDIETLDLTNNEPIGPAHWEYLQPSSSSKPKPLLPKLTSLAGSSNYLVPFLLQMRSSNISLSTQTRNVSSVANFPSLTTLHLRSANIYYHAELPPLTNRELFLGQSSTVGYKTQFHRVYDLIAGLEFELGSRAEAAAPYGARRPEPDTKGLVLTLRSLGLSGLIEWLIRDRPRRRASISWTDPFDNSDADSELRELPGVHKLVFLEDESLEVPEEVWEQLLGWLRRNEDIMSVLLDEDEDEHYYDAGKRSAWQKGKERENWKEKEQATILENFLRFALPDLEVLQLKNGVLV